MITMQIRTLFFDKPTVLRAVDKAKRAVLSKAGAFIRTTAKYSIRTKTGSAPAGRPPHSHEGSLRRLIYFGYDPASDSVVVGPVGFKRSTAPNVLEFGGKTEVSRRRRGKVVRTRVTIDQRPFMGPALEKERPQLPKRWGGSVRGG
ncbi:MAG: hypothetical protein BroJett003_25520 [Planctomycetota bacterium]|nr:MAG: hypothetical protein BroJett003_25520 [Planctomycetota bacterium]